MEHIVLRGDVVRVEGGIDLVYLQENISICLDGVTAILDDYANELR